MALSDLVWQGLFWGAALGSGSVFLGYPLFLALVALVVAKKPSENPSFPVELPSVSMLVVFRNAGNLVSDKIDNFLDLDYPTDKLELILISDGSEDWSNGLAEAFQNRRIRFFPRKAHLGKISGLNTGIPLCRGEIVVFSDVDAMLGSGAVRTLVRHFWNPGIGGVCGLRVVAKNPGAMGEGQKKFIQWDSAVKSLEMRANLSVTSHDGKLYAIRKELFSPVPPGVTDDAYVSLSIIRQGSDFTFDPDARAFIRLPSQDAGHELERRKRIVSTSLRGLWLNRCLFDPRRYGLFAAGLFINKVVRRMVPFFLMIVFLSSLALASSWFYRLMAWSQTAGYGLALMYPLMQGRLETGWGRGVKRISGLAYFFCVGMAGTLLGVVGFLSGEKITKWDPQKK
jgi:cellulose synthase/poly-beta-1,6-N-acetylglucosamine synthase-like glycosyltransferase